jgi:hypothetical protein
MVSQVQAWSCVILALYWIHPQASPHLFRGWGGADFGQRRMCAHVCGVWCVGPGVPVVGSATLLDWTGRPGTRDQTDFLPCCDLEAALKNGAISVAEDSQTGGQRRARVGRLIQNMAPVVWPIQGSRHTDAMTARHVPTSMFDPSFQLGLPGRSMAPKPVRSSAPDGRSRSGANKDQQRPAEASRDH